MVVDDEPEMRESLGHLLTAAGYQVVAVADGREAIQKLATQKFDLVLTDLLMPNKDGIELIFELRAKYPGVPVVAMSGGGYMPRADYLEMARRVGARAILEKPFTTEQMLSTIELLLPAAKT